jgi:hypothetical protein
MYNGLLLEAKPNLLIGEKKRFICEKSGRRGAER